MTSGPSAEPFAFNGVNGASGQYLTPSLTEHDVANLAQGKPLTQPDAPVNTSPVDEQEARHLNELAWRHRVATEATFAPIEGVDPKNLAETGWGVVFAVDANPAVREALTPLLDHRRSLAAAQAETRYRELGGSDGVRPNDTKNDFLARHGAGPGPVDPDKLPYYLLLVGGPQAIPYRFQYHLDVQHAIGRIHFVDEKGADDLDAYANYAHSVIAAETQAPGPRRAAFVGVRNPDDKATTLSASELVQPLSDKVAADQPGWQLQTLLGDAAKKEDLRRVLGGEDTPTLLFTASHGMGFPASDARQLPHQGALLCQDWPGPTQHQGEIPQDFYFAGDDIGADARLLGLIAFHFACFGAGTPQFDDFSHRAFKEPEPIAPHPFVAALPQRLLGHANGGALAVVGHVERAWGYSFLWQQTGRQIDVFSSTLKRLMEGHPVGSAVEFFNERYAELATTLSSELEDLKFGKIPDEYGLAEMWTAHNDARSYAIVGDPAVRLVVSDE
jgi:hypothetical protein